MAKLKKKMCVCEKQVKSNNSNRAPKLTPLPPPRWSRSLTTTTIIIIISSQV